MIDVQEKTGEGEIAVSDSEVAKLSPSGEVSRVKQIIRAFVHPIQTVSNWQQRIRGDMEELIRGILNYDSVPDISDEELNSIFAEEDWENANS